MFKIKDVFIEGFWGQHVVRTDFYEDVNIFIGKNGTGKTTFINLLQSVISVDLELLYSLQFDKIVINLKEGNKKRKIEVEKLAENLQYKEIIYKVGTRKHVLPIIPIREVKYINKRTGRIPSRFFREMQEIKVSLANLINVSYLSVTRDLNDEFKENRSEDVYNIIDARLEKLISDLTAYQLQLETEQSKLSKRFQEDVLRSMLFNEKFDYVKINQEVNLDIREISIGLKQAYKGLGILDNDTEKAIEIHTEAIKKAAQSINESVVNPDKSVYVNDVTPLTLLRRTNKIIELSGKLESDKKRIFERLDDFINLLNEFHDTKYFSLQDSKSGGISVMKHETKIPLNQLSSGEKQLIILLTEALLQKGEETLFIADEPELSLHIEWQRRVISSIKKLNPNSQIIVATHSPEIVGKFKKNIINMERIING